MDLEKIRELLAMVAESGVAEVEIEEDDFKLTVRKNAPTVTMQPGAPSFMPYGMGAFAPPYGAGGYGPQPAPPQPGSPAQNASPHPPAPGAPPAQQPSGGASQGPAPEIEAEEAPADGGGVTVQAPIVGTFYRRPSPDDDPYVEVGDTVAQGDVLCIIEAMKLMNEIECETAGTIKKIFVEDAEPVEYEQPLFVIEEE